MDILKFLKDNKDTIEILFGSGILLAVLGALIRLAVLGIRRSSANRKRVDTRPFKIIPPRSDVAREILGGADDDLLADRNIPYQDRVTGHHIRHELEHQLEESHWLLILAPTNVGKTREAVNLLQTLNQEGWTILYLTREEWLDAPAHKPPDMPDRKVVFFLDDLNRKCYASRVEQTPRAGEVLQPLTMPLQERLERALKIYITFCGGMEEVRIVATARDETEPQAANEPSPWDMLQFAKYAGFWNRFTQYRLPRPGNAASAKALQDIAAQAHIEIQADPLTFARRNDQTFGNIVENFRHMRTEQTPLTLENFRDTLHGSWQEHYQTAIRKHTTARYIYDAIDLLRAIGIDLEPSIVEPTARLLADGRRLRRWQHRWQIRAALRYLISAESILSPRDGQIEAKGTQVDVRRYLLPLQPLILRLADRHGKILLHAVFNLAVELYESRHFAEAGNLFARAIRLDPNYTKAYNNRGVTYHESKQYALALADYTRALELDPNDAQAFYNRGITYNDLKQYELALADYTRALELDPNYATAYNNRGITYHESKQPELALADYTRALELDPNLAQAYYNRGNTYHESKQYELALADYTRAIELDPNYTKAYYNRGLSYAKLEKSELALADYTRAIELDLNYATAYNNRGITYDDLKQYELALADYTRAIELDPNLAQAYFNRGVTYQTLKQSELALADYTRAIELDPNYATAYNNRGITYKTLRQYALALADYTRAIELDPNYATAYNNRGITYKTLKQYALALADYTRALELDPNNAKAYSNRGVTYAAQKNYEKALADYKHAIELDSNNDNAVFNIACAYALQNNVELACSWLRHAIEMSSENLEMARTDSDIDAIRDTPEFKALLKEFEDKK